MVGTFYSRGVEDTDDAQVDGHLVPVASRVEGTIQAVAVDDNQAVKAGATLVQLDPSDNQVALDQAQAQYDQATAQLAASGPNVPMTRITNESDVASDSAGITGAEAAVEAARHDLTGAIAKLKESQAVDERVQANFQRYKTLLGKNEVSRADYDQYKAAAMAQVQTVAANQAAVESAEKTVDQRKRNWHSKGPNCSSQATVRRSDLRFARQTSRVRKPRRSSASSF